MNFERVSYSKYNKSSFTHKPQKKFEFEIIPVYFSNFIIFYDVKIKNNYSDKTHFSQNLLFNNTSIKLGKSYLYKFLTILIFFFILYFFLHILLDLLMQDFLNNSGIIYSQKTQNPSTLNLLLNFNSKQDKIFETVNCSFLSIIVDFCSFYKFLI